MKRLMSTVWIARVTLGMAACFATAGAAASAVFTSAPSTVAAPAGPVLHIAFFALKPEVTAEQRAEFVADVHRYLSGIPGVEEARAGRKALDQRDVHVKDYDIALSIRFRSVADVEAYGPHPKHQEFVAKWRPRFATTRVMDFYGE